MLLPCRRRFWLAPPTPIWNGVARQLIQAHGLNLSATARTLALMYLASADASFRRYFRVDASDPAATRIVMDAPPDKEDSKPFVKVARLMEQAGV